MRISDLGNRFPNPKSAFRNPNSVPLCLCGFLSSLDRQRSRAVANAVLLDSEHVERLQQKVRSGPGAFDVTASLVLPRGAADEHVRYTLVAMQIAVGHIAPPKN